MVRGVLRFPLTRLLVALALFVGLWQVGDVAYLAGLGRLPSAFLERALVTVAALVALFVVGGAIEGRRPAEFGFPRRDVLRDLGLGLLLGAGLLSAIVGVLALFGWYRVTGFLWDRPGGDALAAAGRGLAYYGLVAVSEEVLFRGLLFRIVEDGLGTWVALALSALVFGAAHLTNQGATLWSAAAIALEAGVLFGALYALTRALWLPIGLHWTWNYFEGPVFGAPVSGADQPGLLLPAFAGPDLWSGGTFGPEAGMVAVILCGGLGLLVLVACVRQGKVVAPAWLRRQHRIGATEG